MIQKYIMIRIFLPNKEGPSPVTNIITLQKVIIRRGFNRFTPYFEKGNYGW